MNTNAARRLSLIDVELAQRANGALRDYSRVLDTAELLNERARMIALYFPEAGANLYPHVSRPAMLA